MEKVRESCRKAVFATKNKECVPPNVTELTAARQITPAVNWWGTTAYSRYVVMHTAWAEWLLSATWGCVKESYTLLCWGWLTLLSATYYTWTHYRLTLISQFARHNSCPAGLVKLLNNTGSGTRNGWFEEISSPLFINIQAYSDKSMQFLYSQMQKIKFLQCWPFSRTHFWSRFRTFAPAVSRMSSLTWSIC